MVVCAAAWAPRTNPHRTPNDIQDAMIALACSTPPVTRHTSVAWWAAVCCTGFITATTPLWAGMPTQSTPTPAHTTASKRLAQPDAQGLGPLPASWEGTLPGASGGIDWHLDLQPDGRYQLRMTYDRPDGPQSFDDIGRWARDHTARVVLHGGREAPVLLQPLNDGEALRKLDTTGQIIESTHNDRLKRLPAFTPIEPQLFLMGLFSYMADAPNITLCASQQRVPVAMEKQFPELQAAYRTSGVQPGQVALVSVEGVIAMRPSAEESQPPRATLVVQRFVSISPQGRCPSPQASSPLHNTYWKLVRLGQHPAKTSPQGREAHIVLSATEQRVSGSDGCNRLFGGLTVDGRQLRFGRLASTRMACPDSTGQESAFMDALTRTARFQIRGQHLELLDARGRTLARLEAVALP